MRGHSQYPGWDDDTPDARDDQEYGDDGSDGYDDGYDDGYGGDPRATDDVPDDGSELDAFDDAAGLPLRQDQSLVNVSTTVTHHGAPLLSYTRTMGRFYSNRKQRLSLGRYRCEVCGERIRLWAWETDEGTKTHDGCYERLAWMWTNLYAQQQRLASEGRLE